jgi:hypothetical protein
VLCLCVDVSFCECTCELMVIMGGVEAFIVYVGVVLVVVLVSMVYKDSFISLTHTLLPLRAGRRGPRHAGVAD